MDRLNHINLGGLYAIGVAFGAICFGIGALVGRLLTRRRR